MYGAEVALGLYYKTFLIYRTCVRCAPARPACARFFRSCCRVVVQEHDLRAARAQCNDAKRTLSSHFALGSSHPALHTSDLHFTPHTSSHLISSELFYLSHFMSSHMSAKFFLTIFISSENNSTFLISPKLVSTHLGSSALRRRCIYTEESLQNTLYYKACTKHFPVRLCTTKLAQSYTRLEENTFHLISPLRNSYQFFCMPKNSW